MRRLVAVTVGAVFSEDAVGIVPPEPGTAVASPPPPEHAVANAKIETHPAILNTAILHHYLARVCATVS